MIAGVYLPEATHIKLRNNCFCIGHTNVLSSSCRSRDRLTGLNLLDTSPKHTNTTTRDFALSKNNLTDGHLSGHPTD